MKEKAERRRVGGGRVGRCLVRSSKESKYLVSPARGDRERKKKTAPAPTHTAHPCNLVGGNEGLEAGGWDYR